MSRHLHEGVPEAMAALLKMPGEPYRPDIPPVTHLQSADLAPPEVSLQVFLERSPNRAVEDLLAAMGKSSPAHTCKSILTATAGMSSGASSDTTRSWPYIQPGVGGWEHCTSGPIRLR